MKIVWVIGSHKLQYGKPQWSGEMERLGDDLSGVKLAFDFIE